MTRRGAAGALLARALIAAAVLAAPAEAQRRQPLTIDAYLALRAVADPQLSPDGRYVAFTVTTASLDENRNISKVWVAEIDGDRAWAIVAGTGTERAPRWAPDGSGLGFISPRGGSSQVWRVARKDIEPGRIVEPTRVSNLPTPVSDFIWARDAKSLYLVSDVKWPGVQEIDRRSGEYPTSARIWTSLFHRHWNEWRAGVRQHVFRWSIADERASDITPFDRDVPTIALGGTDLAMSAPGTELAVTFNPDSSVATSTNNDIYVMGPDGSGRQPITTSRANDHSPAYSPDSRYIAYLAMSVPGFESDKQNIVLYERATGRRITITSSWPLSPSAIRWMPDSRSLVAEVEERGERVLYAVEVPGGRTTRLVTGGTNADVRISGDGRFMVFLRQSATAPPEIFRAATDGSGLRPVTRINSEALGKLELPALERMGFVGAANDSVFGWLLRPPGFDASRRYPLIYLIHGGPQTAWLDQWHARWNYQLFAARGYVVAAVNYHGSTGYGQPFTNSISRNWGGLPYEDLMKGLDHLAATQRYLDTARVGAAGASYGGYMVYWMAGQTRRFRTLLAHDGVFNPLSFAGTTEELWFPTHEFGGSPLSPSARALMEKWSPANYLSNWATPMLVVHSQNDFRVDVSEGYQAFTALKLRGVPAKFLYFPDEDHFITKPRNRRLWWATALDWFAGYLTPDLGRT